MKNLEKKSGMIVALDWNSNKWKDEATPTDIKKCTFSYVKATKFSFTCINFGHEVYQASSKGMYRGLIPHLWDSMPNQDESRNVKIVFMKSKNYNDKKTYIVGFYAYPVFCFTQKMPSQILNYTGEFMYNLEAKPTDIHYLDNKINITDDKEAKKYIPNNKEYGKMGYNYITKQNVEKLLDKMTLLNPDDKKLSKIKLSLLKSMMNS